MRVCLMVGMSVFVLLALAAQPASADVVYTFSDGVTFTATPAGNNIECGTSDASNINLTCASVDVTGAASQSIAGTGSLFYYIGSVTANETSNTAPYGPGIVATEAADPHTFVIGFTTAGDVAHTFALTVPVSATEGSFPTGQFTFDTVYDTVVLGDGSTMTAQIWFRQSLPAGTSAANFIIGSSMSPNDASFTWDSGNAVGYLILEMNYVDNSSGVPEPATYVLMGSALVGLAFLRRRKTR